MSTVTATVTAIIEATLGAALENAIKTHLSPVRAEIASNHGHLTKRLFPALEAKLTTLEDTLDSKTRDLAIKGESLLAKITSLDGRIPTNVGGRIEALETKVAAATTTFDARIATLESHGRESTMPVQPARAPAMTSGSESAGSAGSESAGSTTAPAQGNDV